VVIPIVVVETREAPSSTVGSGRSPGPPLLRTAWPLYCYSSKPTHHYALFGFSHSEEAVGDRFKDSAISLQTGFIRLNQTEKMHRWS
jgi:hypothetical protein